MSTVVVTPSRVSALNMTQRAMNIASGDRDYRVPVSLKTRGPPGGASSSSSTGEAKAQKRKHNLLRCSEELTLPPEGIQRTWARWKNTPSLRTIHGVIAACVLGAGLRIKCKQTMHSAAKQTQFEEWICNKFAEILFKILRDQLLDGFGAVTYKPHPEYRWEPVYVNYRNCTIYYTINAADEYTVRYESNINDGAGYSRLGGGLAATDDDPVLTPVPEKPVYTYFSHPFDHDGELTSLTKSLDSLFDFSDFLQDCNVSALKKLSDPSVYVSTAKNNEKQSLVTMGQISAAMAGGHSSTASTAHNDPRVTARDAFSHNMSCLSVYLRNRFGLTLNEALDPRRKETYTQLPEGSKIERQLPPTQPDIKYIEEKSHLEEVLAAAFRVPRSLWTNNNLERHNKRTQASGDSAAEQMLQATCREWMVRLKGIAEEMFGVMYGEELGERVASRADFNPKKDGAYTITDRTKVEFSFPSMIRQKILDQRYDMGAIPWKSYIAHSARTDGIPLEEYCAEAPEEPETQSTGFIPEEEEIDESAGPIVKTKRERAKTQKSKRKVKASRVMSQSTRRFFLLRAKRTERPAASPQPAVVEKTEEKKSEPEQPVRVQRSQQRPVKAGAKKRLVESEQ